MNADIQRIAKTVKQEAFVACKEMLEWAKKASSEKDLREFQHLLGLLDKETRYIQEQIKSARTIVDGKIADLNNDSFDSL